MDSRKNNLSRFDVDMSPFRDFVKHMDRFFNESFREANSIFHLRPFWVDVRETEANVIVEADLPGYKRDQIELEIIGNQLRIAAEDKASQKTQHDNKQYFHSQRSLQRMERFITLPFTIPEKETKAQFEDGKLKVLIPKKNQNRKYIDIHEE
ncbi:MULTISPECIES: Hsp20/alpha crystallin family protein [unclassified Virgibacillus]|uniref:Hsp20/alpha crystallin family protein n=1 Tax=unclassified Virgibacillus TaxID=2620237 RepID=UPI0024DEC7E6|nr:Hsp20/alpha crystallin family protein [Virgibacillus sp. LDC-1]